MVPGEKKKYFRERKVCGKVLNFERNLCFISLWFLLSQEMVDGHPDGRRGDEVSGFLLVVPESLAKGGKGLIHL